MADQFFKQSPTYNDKYEKVREKMSVIIYNSKTRN